MKDTRIYLDGMKAGERVGIEYREKGQRPPLVDVLAECDVLAQPRMFQRGFERGYCHEVDKPVRV